MGYKHSKMKDVMGVPDGDPRFCQSSGGGGNQMLIIKKTEMAHIRPQ